MASSEGQITELLLAWREGDRASLEKLVPMVEKELRRISRNYLRRESPYGTFMTSDLINEAYIKLVNQREPGWTNRSHFFAVASIIIRRILVNHARDRSAAKRAGSAIILNIDDLEIMSSEQTTELLLLDETLLRFAKFDKQKARIVELRYFGGLSTVEIARALNLTTGEVERSWKFARAWLAREMTK